MRRGVHFVVPPALHPGARIAVVAPGSAAARRSVNAGMAVLRRWGYDPCAAPHLFDRRGDLAGDDATRAGDLAWALADPQVSAIWAARGGWGAARLLPHVRIDGLLQRPRWLVGFSDLTALQAVVLDHGVVTLHAPVVTVLASPGRFIADDLRRTLRDPLRPSTFTPGPRSALVAGKAEGPLLGGCLSVLVALTGTPWQPDWRGAVVFLEDVGEAPYRIDRMLWQLRAARVLDGVGGLVFGQFWRCAPQPGRRSRSVPEILREHAAELAVPALGGIPAGHGPRTRCLPLGFSARLDASRGLLALAPPASAR
jgi:muramoyltetrapeptide carboxypeptidase